VAKPDLEIVLPEWIDELGDDRLWDLVIAALRERDWAVGQGADKHPASAAVFRRADVALGTIADKHVTGRAARRKAERLVSRCDPAAKCVQPTAPKKT
jgi:hypothetical protein